jgi:hypothetical protein
MSRAISQAVDLAPRVFALMASQLLCVGLSPYRLLVKVGKNTPLRAAYFCEYATLWI